ncbi:MAG: hypothetical protein RSE29_08370 [Leclercia sp.]
MLAKPIVIVAALLFTVSAQANMLSPDAKTELVVNQQVIANHQSTANHQPTSTRSADQVVTSDSKGEFEHESVVFLAQGMGGFMTF